MASGCAQLLAEPLELLPGFFELAPRFVDGKLALMRCGSADPFDLTRKQHFMLASACHRLDSLGFATEPGLVRLGRSRRCNLCLCQERRDAQLLGRHPAARIGNQLGVETE